jgi:hypothetical protein
MQAARGRWPVKRRGFVPCLVALAACTARPDDPGGSGDGVPVSESYGVQASGTVFGTGGDGLNVRAEPSLHGEIVGHLADGAKVAIGCQRSGDAVNGNPVWDFVIGEGGFIADRYVWTGHASWIPGVPKCDGDSGTAASSSGGGSGPISVRGTVLDPTQAQWVRHVATEVVPQMRGSRAQRIDKAAHVLWWSLKEGILRLDDALSYSNCHVPPDTRIGPTDVCPNPNNAWQVGVSGVQAGWRTLADVEALAADVHPQRSIGETLVAASEAAGFGAASATGSTIAQSTGRLRLSWLLRDGAVGFEAQYPAVQGECFQTFASGWEHTCAWCFGSGWDDSAAFAPSRAAAETSVADLAGLLSDLAP